MKTEKFEEFVVSICKPMGVAPAREEWARMHQLRDRHVRFALIIGRTKKIRYLEIVPEREDLHAFARWLSCNLSMGNTVLWVCYHKECYLRVLSRQTWREDYARIVPEGMRPRTPVGCACKPYRRKETDYQHYKNVKRDKFGKPSDEDITFGNPYRKKCPMHGFERTNHSNTVMSWMGSLMSLTKGA